MCSLDKKISNHWGQIHWGQKHCPLRKRYWKDSREGQDNREWYTQVKILQATHLSPYTDWGIDLSKNLFDNNITQQQILLGLIFASDRNSVGYIYFMFINTGILGNVHCIKAMDTTYIFDFISYTNARIQFLACNTILKTYKALRT